MITPFLLVSGWLFWILLGTIIFITASFNLKDRIGGWLLCIAICIPLYIAFSDVPYEKIYQNPKQTALYVGLYLVIGFGWSVLKWLMYVSQRAKDYANQADRLKKDFNSISRAYSYKEWVFINYEFPPSVARHKEELLSWFLVWPISILRFLLTDFIVKLRDWFYAITRRLYMRLTTIFFKKFTELN